MNQTDTYLQKKNKKQNKKQNSCNYDENINDHGNDDDQDHAGADMMNTTQAMTMNMNN